MRLAGNQRLEDLLLDNLYYQLRLYRYRSSARSGRALKAFGEHVAIVDAIENGDPQAAERVMRIHIRNAYLSLGQEKARESSGRNAKTA